MSTNDLIQAVLKKLPDADIETVLELIVQCDADLNKVFQLLGVGTPSRKRQLTFDTSTTKRAAKARKTTAEVVHLFTAEQVKEAGIYCSLHFDVLEPSTANVLAVDLNEESKYWPEKKFFLFERLVIPSHTSGMYTDDVDVLSGRRVLTYQGRNLVPSELFAFTPEMKQAREKVEEIVRETVPNWKSGALIANKFGDRASKLDLHSDQLTNLGPEPTIVSLSLGCTREFLLKDRTVPPKRPTYSIRLPHNSMLIMHAGCQERFKHGVPPAKSVQPDALIGTSRVSLTFRMYRSEFRTEKLPKCSCGAGMILRNTHPDKAGHYNYIWQCGQSYSDGKGCNDRKLYTGMPN